MRAAALTSPDRWGPEETANLAWACAVLQIRDVSCGELRPLHVDRRPRATFSVLGATMLGGARYARKTRHDMCKCDAVGRFRWQPSQALTSGTDLRFFPSFFWTRQSALLNTVCDALSRNIIAMNRDSLRQVHQFFVTCDLDREMRGRVTTPSASASCASPCPLPSAPARVAPALSLCLSLSLE